MRLQLGRTPLGVLAFTLIASTFGVGTSAVASDVGTTADEPSTALIEETRVTTATLLTQKNTEALTAARESGVSAVPAAASWTADDIEVVVLPSDQESVVRMVSGPRGTLNVQPDGSVVEQPRTTPTRKSVDVNGAAGLNGGAHPMAVSPTPVNLTYWYTVNYNYTECRVGFPSGCADQLIIVSHYYNVTGSNRNFHSMDVYSSVSNRADNNGPVFSGARTYSQPNASSIIANGILVSRQPGSSTTGNCSNYNLGVNGSYAGVSVSFSHTFNRCETWNPINSGASFNTQTYGVQYNGSGWAREYGYIELFTLPPGSNYGWQHGWNIDT